MIKQILLSTFLVISLFLLNSCSQGNFESNNVLLQKAINMAMEGKWPESRKLAQKAVDQNGKDANARTMLALALEQCEEEQLAIEEINQAVTVAPDNFMAQYTKGRLLFKNKRYQDCPDL